ncbi:hypothetical protein BH09VER1_BH09VER1_49170 [soil metagenome]
MVLPLDDIWVFRIPSRPNFEEKWKNNATQPK